MTRPNWAPFAALVVVAVALVATIALRDTDRAETLGGGGGTPPIASPFDDDATEIRRRPTSEPSGPPVLPRVDLGDGLAVTVERVTVTPTIGWGDAFDYRPRRTTAPTSAPTTAAIAERIARRQRPPVRQQVNLQLRVEDARPVRDQDHAFRLAGVRCISPMADMFLCGIIGSRAGGQFVLDPAVRRATLEIAVPAGPFVEVERLVPGDPAVRRGADAPSRAPWHLESIRAARNRKGETSVYLRDGDADADGYADQSWFLEAVTRDGRAVVANSLFGMGDFGTEARIRVPFEDVAYVVYRMQPLTWRTVGEVDLPDYDGYFSTPDHPEGFKVSSVAEVARLMEAYRDRTATRPADQQGGTFRFSSHPPSEQQGPERPMRMRR